MFGTVRRKLRMIRYYSAARPQNAWTTAHDLAMLLSLMLAFPAAWISNISRQPVVVAGAAGQLFQHAAGELEAAVIRAGAARTVEATAKPIGNFDVAVVERRHGWPLITSVQRSPAQLNIDIVAEPKPRRNVRLYKDDPLYVAIHAALEDANELQLLAAMDRSTPQARHHWIAWVGATSVWWIMLTFASALTVQVVKLIVQYCQSRAAARRAHFRAQGKCLTCGYDLTGLEFNERCPECGELVW